MSKAEPVARQQERYDQRNASRHSASAKSDMAPDWVRNDPDLTSASTLDHSITTAETVARRRRRLDSKPAKIDEEWSLSADPANAGRDKAAARALHAPLAVVAAALCTTR